MKRLKNKFPAKYKDLSASHKRALLQDLIYFVYDHYKTKKDEGYIEEIASDAIDMLEKFDHQPCPSNRGAMAESATMRKKEGSHINPLLMLSHVFVPVIVYVFVTQLVLLT